MTTRMVVGLGNPGRRYAQTRHNAGFMVVDLYAERQGLKVERRGHQALYAEQQRPDSRLVLLKPQTYMNLSGQAVGAAARWYKVAPSDIILVYDDLDTEVGRIRLREKGGTGGHNGVASAIAALGTEEIPRIRVGIGRPAPGWEGVDWVLAPFTADEQAAIRDSLVRAADAVETALRFGFARAMNQHNV